MDCKGSPVRVLLLLLAVLATALSLAAARPDSGECAVFLKDPPVSEAFPSLRGARTAAAEDYRSSLRATQTGLVREMESRNFEVAATLQELLNAILVRCPEERRDELRRLPGVLDVVPLPWVELHLNQAVPLVNGPAAWVDLGGVENAGAGVKIAVIDTGIDHTHPAFQDDSLPMPAGFPKCDGEDCAFTNRKIIAARSYVSMVARGSSFADSRPDDLSPRDRVGHGTAVAMTAAGRPVAGPLATITGMAPKAYLGSYKVFGSPGVNDGSTGGAILAALNQARLDGMDIAVLALGGTAVFGPLDSGPACGLSPGVPCDPLAQAVQIAVAGGMIVVASAGNDGDLGAQIPTRNTISSPATAPAAITVGATTNAHTFTSSLRLPGGNVPPNLQSMPARFGDGPLPAAPLTAPLVDVTQLGDNGLACSPPLPLGSLTGSIALVQRGICTFQVKVLNAQNAGAVGVVIFQLEGQDSPIIPGGLGATQIPALMIGNSNGHALRQFLAVNPGAPVTLDPSLFPVSDPDFDRVALFSSRGPSIGNFAVKPEVSAVGTNMYTATQRFDPNGSLFNSGGFTIAQGTSFSAPLVAGVAALVKQRNPSFTPAQVKSAVVNTATPQITENSIPAGVISMGAGKLNAAGAVRTQVVASLSTISFGEVRSDTLPVSQGLNLHNISSSAVNLSLSVETRSASTAHVTMDRTSFTLQPQLATLVVVTLSGSLPAPGTYDGFIVIESGGPAMRIPFFYVVGDGVPFNIMPLLGNGFTGPVGGSIPSGAIAFKLTDRFGVPVRGAAVQFGVLGGGGSIRDAEPSTDAHGIAFAAPQLGLTPGPQGFFGRAGGLTAEFWGAARLQPAISEAGVVNAASFQPGAIAPGSYISLFGAGLSDVFQAAPTATLPLSLAGVSVSFDVPSTGLSLPGRLHFVSPGQVNVQVPWELPPQASVRIKASIGRVSGVVREATVVEASPAAFEYRHPGTGQFFAAALDGDDQVIGPGRAVRPGGAVQLFANGFGRVDHQPPTGEPTPAEPLTRTLAPAEVTVGGRQAEVIFSGLAPFFAGLYQVNFVVPPDTPPGIHEVIVTIGGVSSPPVRIVVE